MYDVDFYVRVSTFAIPWILTLFHWSGHVHASLQYASLVSVGLKQSAHRNVVEGGHG